MAKIAVTIGKEKKSGKWVLLSGPDVPISEQKASFKELKAAGADTFDEAHVLFSPGKKVKFNKPTKKLVVPIVDDLTGLAEAGLKGVISAEDLPVKFSEDHEKTRAAIRAARAEKAEGDEASTPTDDLDEKAVKALKELIEEEGLEIPKDAKTRDDLIAAIRAARAENADAEKKS